MSGSFLSTKYKKNLLGILCLGIGVTVANLVIENSYYLSLIIYAEIFSIAALGFFVLFGLAGQISAGQAAFVGIGAYTSGLIMLETPLPPIVAMVTSVVLCGVIGWAIARPILRLREIYLAMATLAVGQIAYIMFVQLRGITGGLDPGMVGVPKFHIAGFTFANDHQFLWLANICVCLSLLLIMNLTHGRNGRAMRAIRASEVASSGSGIDIVQLKVGAFTLAAALAGLSGTLLAFYQSAFNASNFTVYQSIEFLLMVVIGSIFSPWGAIFGAYFVVVMPLALQDFDDYKLLIYGLLLTVTVVFAPGGLVKGLLDGARLLYRRASSQ